MELATFQNFRPEQRLLLLPRLLQSVEVLMLPGLCLAEWVREAAAANEALLLEEERPLPEEGPSALPGADPMDQAGPLERRGGGGREEESAGVLALQAAPTGTLAEELWTQVAGRELAPRVREAFDFLVESLDRNGHLTLGLEGAATAHGGELPEEAWLEAYALLRSLQPRGVGATGPVECVLAQLDPDDPDLEAIVRLLAEPLEDLAFGRLGKVARSLGWARKELERLLGRLRGLDPFPGLRFQGGPARPVFPDVRVTQDPRGGFEVSLEERGSPRLAVDPVFVSRLRHARESRSLKAELRTRLRSARWLIEALGHRRETLYRVARELVARQESFFLSGPVALAPLRMEEVARSLGLHLSTVSRTVAGKWLQCAHGLFPLRSFFQGPVSAGGTASRSALRERIRTLIAGEAPGAPLSDGAIAARLAAEGVRVARRTVAAHRVELDLPPAWKRRRR